jgi:hypothetical protein
MLPIAMAQRAGKLSAVAALVALAALGGCEQPIETVDLRTAPQATWDAMLKIKVIPLGSPTPSGTGAIGPVSGVGCAQASVDASGQAVEQLRVKALRLHATAVTDVLIEPGSAFTCPGNYVSVANGMAVGPRAIPSSY